MPFSSLADYLKTPIWALKRARKLILAAYQCEKCGKTTSNVFHKRYDTLGSESMSDLEVLCNRCHKN